jgi:hypothetical protein
VLGGGFRRGTDPAAGSDSVHADLRRCGILDALMNRVTILFVAANPAATPRLALDEEAREIDAKIRAAEHRDVFELVTQWAVRPDDLLDALMRYRPRVVHFSGHGNEPDELVLAGDDGQPRPVPKAALTRLFRTLKDDVRVVVLNACFSRPQAEAIAEHVDCVVGMRRAIGDRAAVRFAASFYRALAFGRSVANAFEQGLVSLELEGIGESDTPSLVVRAGVDPDAVVLVPASPSERPPTPPPQSRPALTQNKEAALTDLFVQAFDGSMSGLRQWVHRYLGVQIHRELPGEGVSLSQLAFETTLAAGRHGRADAAMFASLCQERPNLTPQIRDVARLYGVTL